MNYEIPYVLFENLIMDDIVTESAEVREEDVIIKTNSNLLIQIFTPDK